MVYLRIAIVVLMCWLAGGCRSDDAVYGQESLRFAPKTGPRSIAIAPTLNLSGQRVDPLLQSDIVFQELQQVRGLVVIPVNRVAETFMALRITQIESNEQAAVVCEQLGVDALLVPTITLWDAYNPPKMGASLQLFVANGLQMRRRGIDPREITRQATPGEMESLPRNADFIQATRMFDAQSGHTRSRISAYAAGRHDPLGPMGEREYLLHMDRYAAFVWHELVGDVLSQLTP
jgi:hypothetical protein